MRFEARMLKIMGLLGLSFLLLSFHLTLDAAYAKDIFNKTQSVERLPDQSLSPLKQDAPPQPQENLPEPASPSTSTLESLPVQEATSAGNPNTTSQNALSQSPNKPASKMTAVKQMGKKVGKVFEKAPLGKPVGQVLIFPVLPQNTAKAFGDLPILFSDEFAAELMQKAAPIQVHNPVYTLEEIKAQGLESTYRKIMEYYVRAHRPEPKALTFLLTELKDVLGNAPIERVVFVESDFDINYMTKATRISDRIKQWTTDGIPKDSSYYLRSRIQVFDTSQPEMPMVWGNTWSGVVHGDQFYNMTPSVFHDSDSRMAFSKTSRWMSRQLMLTMSPLVLHHPYDATTDQNVQGKLAP